MPIETNEPANQQKLGGCLERFVMCEFTQGVCEDGAAILKDGEPLDTEEILIGLRLVAEWKAMGEILRIMPGNKQIESAFMRKAFEKKVDDFLGT